MKRYLLLALLPLVLLGGCSLDSRPESCRTEEVIAGKLTDSGLNQQQRQGLERSLDAVSKLCSKDQK